MACLGLGLMKTLVARSQMWAMALMGDPGQRLMERVLASDMGVLAIDPGETSGFAWLPSPQARARDHMNVHGVCMATATGMWGAVDQAIAVLPMVDVCVVESWRLYHWAAKTRINSDMPESRLIGAIELAARQAGVPVVFQPAMVTKSKPWVDDWLKRERGKLGSDHERDALKHLVHYCTSSAHICP